MHRVGRLQSTPRQPGAILINRSGEVISVSGLPRRSFLAATAALSAAWALPSDLLGAALAAPLQPSGAPTTLLQTIRQLATPQKMRYRTLVNAPGEPYVTRTDLMNGDPDPKRATRRRSLLYAGHLSDIHLIDAQSPARLEPLEAVAPSAMSDASRPQDTLTTYVLAQMVASFADARFSPLTGAPMAAAFVTGDAADSRSSLELSWYVQILDGGSLIPGSGTPGVYEGVQGWAGADYAWHPEDPALDVFGEYGFPTVPGLLNTAVSGPTNSVGLPVPWYAVYGNHDTLFMGNLRLASYQENWALGNRKTSTGEATIRDVMADGWVAESSAFQRLLNRIMATVDIDAGVHTVTADPRRKLFDQRGFMQAHFDSGPVPGPVGHGFTSRNLDTGETWWQTDIDPIFRVFGLDTCNQVMGADGAVPLTQFRWLRDQLGKAQADNKLCIVTSHHNSYTLENPAEPVQGGERLVHGEEFVAMLQEFPNMIAWINGHTHVNTIVSHLKPGGGGFWEITTASCVDYPQQQQAIEIVDNRDGTLSIFTTVLDHQSPAQWNHGDFSQTGLASLSRQLASNDWQVNPLMRQGSPLDRNCELLLPAPADLSSLTDRELELAHAAQHARLVAYAKGSKP